jgi:hypothetical protein
MQCAGGLFTGNLSKLWIWQFYRLLKVVGAFDFCFSPVDFIVARNIQHIKFRPAEDKI